ncbi:MAG: aldehyde ferredoxin oxidoreductase family protein [Sulfolobales archaeon]
MYASYGKVLKVNLSDGVVREYVLGDEVLRRYIGGSGLNAYFLYDLVRKYGRVKPFSEENILAFSVGPLTGTGFPMTGRYYVSGISPLTGIYGQASSGGRFGPQLRRCGYISIVIEGVSEKPVYIKIDQEGVEIGDASNIWGYGVYETQEKLLKTLPGYSIACIGQAGEHLVKYASIMNDGGRAAGRTGLGALMGYKRLKAIAVKGWLRPHISDEGKFSELVGEAYEAVKQAPSAKVLHDYGTSGMIEPLYELGDVPIKNFTRGEWDREKIREISGVTMARKYLKKRYYCEACSVGCGRIVELDGKMVDGPEYETVASLGSNLLNADLEAIMLANYLCNNYGMDTISTGVTIAFAIECAERGLIKKEELSVEWGGGKEITKLISRIAMREGIGNLLAEGVRILSESLGRETKSFAMHVKGLEVPMHDPRAFASWALGYATSNRGACHTYAPVYYIEKGLTFPEIGLPEPLDRFDVKTKPRAVKLIQDMAEFLDSMVMCRFCLYSGIRLPLILRAVNAVLGVELSVDDAVRIGERIFNVKRYINNIQGISRSDDELPTRLFEPLNPPGGSQGFTVSNFNTLLEEYYELRGWNPDGTVPLTLLEKLDVL